MKRLRFVKPLPKQILRGEKSITWRIDDEKGITVGDVLSLQHTDNKEFARAKVLWVKDTTFENLTGEDKEGHEEYASDEEMYKLYSKWYNMKVTPKTKLKVIRFKLLP